MRKLFFVAIYFIAAVTTYVFRTGPSVLGDFTEVTGAPPGGIAEDQVPEDLSIYSTLQNWQRPDVPTKVGIQVGHWKNDEVPQELENLKKNTGAVGAGYREVDTNLEIAGLMASFLREEGIEVDILPTTVPPGYWADVFLAVHADGSEDPSKEGYKFAAPWRDFTRKSDKLVSLLERHYEAATGMERDTVITRNMRGYYAFAWWRYEHAMHPMTTAVIAETGFITNAHDRNILVNTPEISARAMADAIVEFLISEGLL